MRPSPFTPNTPYPRRRIDPWLISHGFDANQVEPTNDFEPIPAGKYVAVITESEMKPTKAGTGSYLQLTFQILEGEHKNRLLWTRLNLDNPNATAVQIARSELSAICRAVGVMTPSDSVELHNLPLVIHVRCKTPGRHRRDHQRDQGLRQEEIPPTANRNRQATARRRGSGRVIELELPYPPSVNHYWRRVGARTLISRGGRAFRQTGLLDPRGARRARRSVEPWRSRSSCFRPIAAGATWITCRKRCSTRWPTAVRITTTARSSTSIRGSVLPSRAGWSPYGYGDWRNDPAETPRTLRVVRQVDGSR